MTPDCSFSEAAEKASHAKSDVPSVDDLLAAAKSIGAPAPIAKEPMRSTQQPTPKPVQTPPKPVQAQPKPKPAETSKAQPKNPQPTQPQSQTSQPKPSGKTKDQAGKPLRLSSDYLAAIQMAALQAAKSQGNDSDSPESQSPSQTPKEAKPASKSLDSNPTIEIPEGDPQRRPKNPRPVDLAKSADGEDSTFIRVNPDSEQPPTAPSRLQNANSVDENLAVPDQIKKLTDSIANFAKPVKNKPKDNPNGEF